MTCPQGTRQLKFIQFSKENGQKLSKSNVLFVIVNFAKYNFVTLPQVEMEFWKAFKK